MLAPSNHTEEILYRAVDRICTKLSFDQTDKFFDDIVSALNTAISQERDVCASIARQYYDWSGDGEETSAGVARLIDAAIRTQPSYILDSAARADKCPAISVPFPVVDKELGTDAYTDESLSQYIARVASSPAIKD